MQRLLYVTIIGALIIVGCVPTKTRKLESIAKGWSEVIRASQVIPVYPLTEDLQPGDVFIVTQSVHEQQELFKDEGFLPLDFHFARIDNFAGEDGYKEYYKADYFQADFNTPPYSRHMPSPGVSDQQRTGAGKPFSVPQVSFPTYNFNLDRETGLELAIPLSGLPVGLGVLGTTSARGAVHLKSAFSYGLPMKTVIEKTVDWFFKNGDDNLAQKIWPLRRAHDGAMYVRVVSRVFLVGNVDVQISDTSRFDLGLAQGDNLPAPEVDISSIERANKLNAALRNNNATASNYPGRFSFTSASNSSVSLTETFSRPLVIGYHGVDFPILDNGILGTPVATTYYLYENAQPVTGIYSTKDEFREIYPLLAQKTPDCRAQLYESLLDYTSAMRDRDDLQRLYKEFEKNTTNATSEAKFWSAFRSKVNTPDMLDVFGFQPATGDPEVTPWFYTESQIVHFMESELTRIRECSGR